MKYLIPLMMTLLIFSACKKNLNSCTDYKEITGREKAVDVTAIGEKDLLDTLAKYPQLVPYRATSNAYTKEILCRMYYNDLLVFSGDYRLFKPGMHDTIISAGHIPVNLNISLMPAVGYKTAIKEARNYINFDHSCIAYQLGLYDMKQWGPQPADYRLAWKIMDAKITDRCVIMDASTNGVITYSGGIIWN